MHTIAKFNLFAFYFSRSLFFVAFSDSMIEKINRQIEGNVLSSGKLASDIWNLNYCIWMFHFGKILFKIP